MDAPPTTTSPVPHSHAHAHELRRSASAQSTASSASSASSASASASASLDADGGITVHIVSPPLTFPAATPPSRLILKPHHTVHKLKRFIQKQWPGKPRADGIRLIHAGKILQDPQTLQNLLRSGEHQDVYIHLVVRPDAWTESETAPLPSPSLASASANAQPSTSTSSLRAQPAPQRAPSSSYFSIPTQEESGNDASTAAAAAVAAGPAAPAPPPRQLRFGDIANIAELPRILDIADSLYYHRYTLLYEFVMQPDTTEARTQWHQRQTQWASQAESKTGYPLEIFDEIEEILFGWQSWHDVTQSGDEERALLAEMAANSNPQQPSHWTHALLKACQHRRECIDNMLQQVQRANRLANVEPFSYMRSPNYILPEPRTPRPGDGANTPIPGMQHVHPYRLYHQLHREQQQQQQQQPQGHGQGQEGRPAPGNVPPNAAPAPAPAPAPASAPAPLHFTELVSLFLPIFFLAVKLAIGIYILSHNASPTRKHIMYGGSLLYLLFETYRVWARRQRQVQYERRRRERGERGARAERGEQPQRTGRGATNRRHATPSTPSWVLPLPPSAAPLAPRRFTTTSVTDYRYWMQRIAFAGLEMEDLEMGFRPRPHQGRTWLLQLTIERIAARRRAAGGVQGRFAALNPRAAAAHVWHGFALYFATLIPELEEMRGEQVRKRDHMIRHWWSSKGKQWVEDQREKREQRRRDGNDIDDDDRFARPELPRFLRHPYVLRLLQLESTPDGLVRPLNESRDASSSTSAATGPQINIQEELDAARDVQRGRTHDAIAEEEEDEVEAAAAAVEEAEADRNAEAADVRAQEEAEAQAGFF